MKGVSISSDGNVLAAFGDYVWISKNRGRTWINVTRSKVFPGSDGWKSLAMSASGEKLVAASSTELWMSIDYGQTWTLRKSANPSTDIGEDFESSVSVAMSSTGEKLALVSSDGIWLSHNFGMDWSKVQMKGGPRIRVWASIASSGDGSKLVAVSEIVMSNRASRVMGDIWGSDDSGTSWVNKTIAMASAQTSWDFVAISADGNTLAAVRGDGSISTSNNFGTTWVNRTHTAHVGRSNLGKLNANSSRPINSLPRQAWSSIASSTDGACIIVTAENGTIWISRDSGTSWDGRENVGIVSPWGDSTFQEWTSSGISSDCRIVGVASNQGAWMSEDFGTTWKLRVPQSDNPNQSWSEIQLSRDGNLMFLKSNKIWISRDRGKLWRDIGGPDNVRWMFLIITDSGYKLLAATLTDLWSYNVGSNHWDRQYSWANLDRNFRWRSIAASSDGARMAVAANDGVWISRDDGKTWSPARFPQVNSRMKWSNICSSADGSILSVVSSTRDELGSRIWISTTQGASWINRTSSSQVRNKRWNQLSISNNGKTIIASTVNDDNGNGEIWISADQGINWKQVTATNR